MMVERSTLLFLMLNVASTAAQPTKLALGNLKWSEEFSYSNGGVDPSRWSHDIGTGDWGWGNGEVQYYSDSLQNVRVEGGTLALSVTRDANGAFSSGRIRTNGKVEFLYGSVEVKLRLPNLQSGLWPAFWMLGSNFYRAGWPYCGELDIMEAGQATSIAHGTVNQVVSSAAHWSHMGNYASYGEHVTLNHSFVGQWQVFRMDWTPDRVSTFVGDDHIWSLDIGECRHTGQCLEFHQPYYFVANVAVGGRFTGIMTADDITASPGQMEIDWIRIYDNEVVNATMTAGGILNAPPASYHDNVIHTDYGVIDCGKPESCNAGVLNTLVDETSTCRDHIEYLMNDRGRDEFYACDSVARKTYPQCAGCDPGTGAPRVDYQFNCGDQNGDYCSNAVLNTDAPQPVGHTCGEHMLHLIEVMGKSEPEACAQVAGEDYRRECGRCIHHVISCGKPSNSACYDVLDQMVGDYTCRERISWMVYDQNSSQADACEHVATDSESSSVCAPCRP